MANLKTEAKGAIKWTSLSSGIIALLQFAQLLVLSRFLSAEDFGLVAIVIVVIGFARLFSDMGISNAIIYEQKVSELQLSTLYWVNILSGIILSIIIFLIAPLISLFYESSGITPLLRVLSLTFFINAIGNQYKSLLKKEIRFKVLAKIEIASAVAIFLSAVVFAYYGYGAFSVIYATLIGAIIASLLFLKIGLKMHRPKLIFRLKEVIFFLKFGLYQMGQNSIGYFNNQFDVILVGKLLGTETLGVYHLVKQLVMRPSRIINPIVTNVAFPLMAKIQKDTLRLKSIYLRMINYLSSINFPIHAMMYILAYELIIVLLGDKWLAGVEIFKILSVYALIRSTMSLAGSLVLAKGRADIGFWWSFAGFIYIPIAIYIGHYWGIIGISLGLLSYQVTFSLANWFFIVKKLINASMWDYYKAQLIPLGIILLTLLLTYLPFVSFNLEPIVKIVVCLGLSSVVYLIISYFLNRGFYNELIGFLSNKRF